MLHTLFRNIDIEYNICFLKCKMGHKPPHVKLDMIDLNVHFYCSSQIMLALLKYANNTFRPSNDKMICDFH